jgi:hypothetical protein
MITTNMSSRGDPTTYTRLREECERLLEIAKAIEAFTRTQRPFDDDDEFVRLLDEFKRIRAEVLSISP